MNEEKPTIALLADHILGEYQTIIRDAAEMTAKESGANFICVIGRALDSPNRYEQIQNEIFNDVSSSSVSGIVIMGAGLSIYAGTKSIVDFCRRFAPIPVCNIGLRLPEIPSVVVDNRIIAHAVTHLAKSHHCERFAYIGGPSVNEEAQIRRQAFLSALDDLGIPFDPELESVGEFSVDSGSAAATHLLATGKSFDALVVAGDMMVLGALTILKNHGIDVPGDVKVTGFDDIPSARFNVPSISSIRQPLEEMGHYAMDTVLKQIRGEKVELLKEMSPVFIKRQSCGCSHGKRELVVKETIRFDVNNSLEILRSRREAFEQVLVSNCQIPKQAFSRWALRLVDALMNEIEGASGSFVFELETILKSSEYRTWLIDELQHVISVLREQFHGLAETVTGDVESLWHDARLVLSDAAAYAQMQDQTAADMMNSIFLRRAGAELPAELTESALVKAVSSELKTIGFANAWVSVYPDSTAAELECIAAVHDGKAMDAKRTRYHARSIVPPFLQGEKRMSYVVIPLSSGSDRLGVIGLELGAANLYYEILREHMSSYLKSIAIFQNRVEALMAEADKQRREIEMQHRQKLESLGVLAGGIAHDFNNMLSAMAGNLDTALLDLEDNRIQSEPIVECKAVVKHASLLCRQLLAYSGKGQFLVKRLNINDLLNELRDLLNVSVAKRATLLFELDEQLPDIEGDVAQINQVFVNLVINAAEAAGQGGGKVLVRTATRFLEASYFDDNIVGAKLASDSYVYTEVSDTGTGIPPEIKDKIFDPFFTTKFTGRGLGLAAVLGIVRGHKGAVKVHSTKGVGTRFEVVFPILKRLSVIPKHSTAPPPKWTGRGAVLLVDDEPTVLRAGGRLLKRMGFEVLTASGGQEGIDILSSRAHVVTVVILDITMPGKGGIETMDAMRKIDSKLPIVLTSGYSEQYAAASLGNESPSAFLQKPYDMQQLNLVLGKVLKLHPK
jgi:DNA-binding LacI/PurR family transcriptional regulator/signal transduction histidine kinase